MKDSFNTLFSKPVADNGFNQPADKLAKRYATGLMRGAAPAVNDNAQQLHTNGPPLDVVEMVDNRPTQDRVPVAPGKPIDIGNGDVLIAAITSCTNTSNPGVLLAAGLLAKKAAAKGLKVKRHVKTSLAPGSRVVTEYLTSAGLLAELEKLNFYLAGYGCTTCIGNAGPLDPAIEETITKNDLVCAAVLSGNRNFEARIHPNIKANFLASPPLVVAYAIAGRANIDMTTEPLGTGKRRRAGVPARHLAVDRGDRRGDAIRDRPGDVSPSVRRLHQGQPACGMRSRRRPGRSTSGTNRPTSPSRRSSRTSRCIPAHCR